MNLFTYGSLMCSDIMFKVAGCQADFIPATLNDFFRSKMRNEEYPGITANPQTIVPGVLYFDLPAEAIHRLDAFEGEMYQRQDIHVITEKNDQVSAMTYVIKPQYKHFLTNQEWSFTEFLATGKPKFEETYFGFQEI